MSKSLRYAALCLAVLAVAGCKQQPAAPAPSQPKPAAVATATPTGNDAEARALHVLEARLQSDHFYPDNCISILSEQGDAPTRMPSNSQCTSAMATTALATRRPARYATASACKPMAQYSGTTWSMPISSTTPSMRVACSDAFAR